MTAVLSRSLIALTIAVVAATCFVACDADERYEQEELDRVEVPDALQLVEEGQKDRFIYRTYVAERPVTPRSIAPPSEDYVDVPTTDPEIWPGWRPAAFGEVLRPTGNGNASSRWKLRPTPQMAEPTSARKSKACSGMMVRSSECECRAGTPNTLLTNAKRAERESPGA